MHRGDKCKHDPCGRQCSPECRSCSLSNTFTQKLCRLRILSRCNVRVGGGAWSWSGAKYNGRDSNLRTEHVAAKLHHVSARAGSFAVSHWFGTWFGNSCGHMAPFKRRSVLWLAVRQSVGRFEKKKCRIGDVTAILETTTATVQITHNRSLDLRYGSKVDVIYENVNDAYNVGLPNLQRGIIDLGLEQNFHFLFDAVNEDCHF
jgi:hypothetical protein